jgi:hypothetical protein
MKAGCQVQAIFDLTTDPYNTTFYIIVILLLNMIIDFAAHVIGDLFHLINNLVSEIRTRMIAKRLIRSAAAAAASYRAAHRVRRRTRLPSKLCLVLEDADPSRMWLERFERKRSSRQLESLRDAIIAANEIIAATFSSR